MLLNLENTVSTLVTKLLPHNKEESQMKMLNVGIRYSHSWYLASNQDEITLSPEQIVEIEQELLACNLPIRFDGWCFESDVTYDLNFVNLMYGSYYCFELLPKSSEHFISEYESEWTAKRMITYVDTNRLDTNGHYAISGFGSMHWDFTTYHDSCWRDGAYSGMRTMDNKITNFMYNLFKKYNLEIGIRFNVPNFAIIDNIETYDIIRFRGNNDLYSRNTNHLFSKINDKVVWVDLSSYEFCDSIKNVLVNHNLCDIANIPEEIKFGNSESSDLAVILKDENQMIIKREIIYDILSTMITKKEKE